MRKLTYLAVFEPTKTGYSIYFPDFPGCISCAEGYGEAQKQAEEVLGLHIYGMEKDGDEIPVPSKKPQGSRNSRWIYSILGYSFPRPCKE